MVPLIAAGMASSMAGGLLGAFGQIQNARTSSRIAWENAQIARQQAQLTRLRTQQQLSAIRLQAPRMIGRQTAMAAASGVVANTGSPLEVQQQTRELALQDMSRLRQQSALEQVIYGRQASIYDLQGNSIMRSLPFNVASTLLGSVGQASMMMASAPSSPSISSASSSGLTGFSSNGYDFLVNTPR